MLSLLVAPFLPADTDSQDVEAARQDGLDRIEHVAYAAAGQKRPATLMVDGREVLLETALQEALIFDEHKHPRWPKGSPGGLGGQPGPWIDRCETNKNAAMSSSRQVI